MPKLIMVRKVGANRPEILQVSCGNGTDLYARAIAVYNGKRVSGFPTDVKFDPKTDLLLGWDENTQRMTTFNRDELQEEVE